jgi:hypothetical protein
MNTNSVTVRPAGLNDPVLRDADIAAVLEHIVSGQPLDSAIVTRVCIRAEEVTENIRRDHGLLPDEEFQSLLEDEA